MELGKIYTKKESLLLLSQTTQKDDVMSKHGITSSSEKELLEETKKSIVSSKIKYPVMSYQELNNLCYDMGVYLSDYQNCRNETFPTDQYLHIKTFLSQYPNDIDFLYYININLHRIIFHRSRQESDLVSIIYNDIPDYYNLVVVDKNQDSKLAILSILGVYFVIAILCNLYHLNGIVALVIYLLFSFGIYMIINLSQNYKKNNLKKVFVAMIIMLLLNWISLLFCSNEIYYTTEKITSISIDNVNKNFKQECLKKDKNNFYIKEINEVKSNHHYIPFIFLKEKKLISREQMCDYN